MQKINIKKYTKEQMLKMLETAYEANESATAELERTAAQIHAQQEEIAVLRAKLTETEKALDVANAQYKSADHAAKNMRGKIEYLDKALSEATEKREAAKKEAEALRSEIARANEARKKAESEGRELAHLLGKRELELAEAKQRREDTLRGMEELKGQLKAAEGRAKRKDELLDEALHRLEVEKAIAEDYHESLKWCMAHPWRNVWRCMKEYFRF